MAKLIDKVQLWVKYITFFAPFVLLAFLIVLVTPVVAHLLVVIVLVVVGCVVVSYLNDFIVKFREKREARL